MKTYLITGVAGFIGSNLTKQILNEEQDCRDLFNMEVYKL